MKTLDEVIKANECCDHGEMDSRCEDCPYSGIGACCLERETDALHYLKAYRSDQLEWEANRKAWNLVEEDLISARMKYIAKLKELGIGTLNDPLTWDELRQMCGKPVWVENMFYKKWLIAYQINENDIIFDGNGFYTQAFVIDYGKSWQAYRKERTE